MGRRPLAFPGAPASGATSPTGHFVTEWQIDDRRQVVSYRDLPLDVFLAGVAHMRSLQREVLLLRRGQAGGSGGVAVEVGRALDETLNGYRAFERQSLYDATLAHQTGAGRFSFEFRVPGIAAADFERVFHTLRRLDEHCRRGDLLTPPAPPGAVALRQWIAEETAHQLAGGAPRGCPL